MSAFYNIPRPIGTAIGSAEPKAARNLRPALRIYPSSQQMEAIMTDKSRIQGEGDYEAARRFDDAERAFVETGPVKQKAREAEQALDGPEGAELERARVESGKGETG